ncbi:probable cation-transporting ATPase 13A4 isoform X1 [Bufo gargarizans]|uniref:probable cation-transporting ATPase 13A4 isoform X1 n=1 Tax=Bufo gargarizans TaxID=30331 RepID=UPI001CF1A0F3|nr:probable cation-transporting ATPase 13A4 isoform X1 [Bufo gargarizans]
MKSKEHKDHRAKINEGQENEMELFGYRMSVPWIILCVVGYFISGGILLLLFYWKPEWSVWANCVPSSLEKANVVLLRTTDERKKYTRKKVRWLSLDAFAHLFQSGLQCSVICDKNSTLNNAIRRPDLKVKFIRVQKIRYVWNFSQKKFENIGTLEDELSCFSIHSYYASGLTEEEQAIRNLICGHNTIEVEVAPLWKILIFKVLNALYIYQIAAIILMLVENYLGYGLAILVLCICDITLAMIEHRKQSSKLHNLVKAHNNMKVTVYKKNGDCSQVESRYLVPGDIIVLSGKEFFMSCDAILVNGTCVVNEGMLTGESIPVTKTQLPHGDDSMPWKQYSGEDYKRHVMFCGTEVIRTESTAQGPARAVVLRTGFNTTKGDMVRSILYPKPINFKLNRDVRWFFIFLACLALIGLIYAVTIFAQRKVPAGRIIVEAAVLIICAISPVIPAALMVGIMYAKRRLRKKHIHCISPDRINMCGQVNLFCFDKTGTLTEDGLDLMGVIPSGGSSFQAMVTLEHIKELSCGPLFAAMACCHSIIMLDGKLQGDPLDLKMFEATGWVIDESMSDIQDGHSSQNIIVRPGPNSEIKDNVKGIQVLFQYPFSSVMQRMSVIAEANGGDELIVYMKGAPEMVASFCKTESVPSGFLKELERHTFQGLRVIGVAAKTLGKCNYEDLQSMEREDVERDLEFLGLLILENRLKPETSMVVKELHAANIRMVMITGDNIQTATTVAKNCGMIPEGKDVILVEASGPEGSAPAFLSWKLVEYPEDAKQDKDLCIKDEDFLDRKDQNSDCHFSMSGKTYENLEKYFCDLLPKILMNVTVFARMSPGQKSTIIDELQKLDYCVGMCGDGANDCAALKIANAGISLSEQEASVAAPFNSQVTNISCVPDLLKEGRAAIVTSFCMFKYMAMFGLTEYINTLLLYWQRNIFGNNQWLIHDFAIVFVIFFTMSSTPAYPKLAPYRPPGQLISPSMLFSLIFNVLFTIAMHTYAFLMVQKQAWYSNIDIYSACYPGNESLNKNLTYILIHERTKINYESFESTTLWLITCLHLVIFAFVFSKGKPFRKPLYTNYLFVVVLIIETAFNIFFIFADFTSIYLDLELVCTPMSWRIHMLILLVVCLVVTFVVEEFILDNRALWLAMKTCLKIKPGSKYKKFHTILEEDKDWPPIGRTIYGNGLTDGDARIYINQGYEHDSALSTEEGFDNGQQNGKK